MKKDIIYSFIKEVLHLKVFAQRGKITNGDLWTNFGARGTISLQKNLDLKFGLSEYLTAPRGASILDLGNHCSLRGDAGVFYQFAPNLSVGYIWSGRFPIDGYTSTSMDNELHETREWLEIRYTL